MIAWNREYLDGRSKRTVFRALTYSFNSTEATVTFDSERIITAGKDPTVFVHPNPREVGTTSDPMFWISSDPAAASDAVILNWGKYDSTLSSLLTALADALEGTGASVTTASNVVMTNANFFAGTAGYGWFVSCLECINDGALGQSQIWTLAGDVEASADSWVMFTDVAEQEERPAFIMEYSGQLLHVASTSTVLISADPDPQYRLDYTPIVVVSGFPSTTSILSVGVGNWLVVEHGEFIDATISPPKTIPLRGRYKVLSDVSIGVIYEAELERQSVAGSDNEEDVDTVLELSTLESEGSVAFKTYEQMTFTGYPAICLSWSESEGVIVHLFWFESAVPSPRNRSGLGIDSFHTLYLRYKRGILIAKPSFELFGF